MRKTKIICTIGPASEKPEVFREMCLKGLNVARLNFSHGTPYRDLPQRENHSSGRRQLHIYNP